MRAMKALISSLDPQLQHSPVAESFEEVGSWQDLRNVEENSVVKVKAGRTSRGTIVTPYPLYLILTSHQAKHWRPVTLRWYFLVVMIVLSVALIVVIQLLHQKSRKDGGLLFDPAINSLPLRSTFQYLHLPTIIFVSYSLLWTWIDLDVRRLEPFYQMSKPGGAKGSESVLLNYPVDFILEVPIRAARLGHWAVCATSIAALTASWGLIPLQAAVFAVSSANLTTNVTMVYSTDYLTVEQQVNTISAEAATSVANILWLNETLQPFMTRQFYVAPFSPMSNESMYAHGSSESWTGETYRVSVNVSCETVTAYPDAQNDFAYLNSTWGCHLLAPDPQPLSDSNSSKVFSGLYVGYYDPDGLAGYSLDDGICPSDANDTFLIQWEKSLVTNEEFVNLTLAQQLENSNTTWLFCRPVFYSQAIKATVLLPAYQVVDYSVLEDPKPLPSDMFNSTAFQIAMNSGKDPIQNRTSFPTANWPWQDAFLFNSPINLQQIPNMAPFSIGVSQLPAEEYLDPQTLQESYESAYQVLFARKMVSVISNSTDPRTTSIGARKVITEAIIVVPAFAYAVQGLLCVIVFLTSCIWYLRYTEALNLQQDPGTIENTMTLCANDGKLLAAFMSLDREPATGIVSRCRESTFQIEPVESKQQTTLSLVDDQILRRDEKPKSHSVDDEVLGLRPWELSYKTGAFLVAFLMALLMVNAILFFKVQNHNGLGLPSQSRFVRALLESYLPTALGTLVEPIWLVLNRHLCMLKPFDALRQANRKAKDSIGLRYNCLPPQFVVIMALKNSHFLLSALSFMSLLAHIFAIAMAGLFFEDSTTQTLISSFEPPYSLQFLPLNGSAGPFIPVEAGLTEEGLVEPFYVFMSNLTAGTPLPPWTDEEWFYLPFMDSQPQMSFRYEATTPAIRISSSCIAPDYNLAMQGVAPIQAPFQANSTSSFPDSAVLSIYLQNDNNKTVQCVPRYPFAFPYEDFQLAGATVNMINAFELNAALDGPPGCESDDCAFCREHLASVWGRAFIIPNGQGIDTGFNISDVEATVMACRSRLQTAIADLVVDSNGYVLRQLAIRDFSNNTDSIFQTKPTDLLGQVHQFMQSTILDSTWHTDSYPSDFNNYLLNLRMNSSTFLDYKSPSPTFDSMVGPVSAQFSTLFAIILGRYMKLLLVSSSGGTSTVIGEIQQETIRIFMSKPFFIISETILLLNIVVALVLYFKRPWNTLCRLPINTASVIAFFAASHAVLDFRSPPIAYATGDRLNGGNNQHQYGFGTFFGIDGEVHLGVEKHPYLAVLRKTKSSLSWKNAPSHKWSKWKVFDFQSSKIQEGGLF